MFYIIQNKYIPVVHYDLRVKICSSYWKSVNCFKYKTFTISNLSANYKRIFEVLRKISKEELLAY